MDATELRARMGEMGYGYDTDADGLGVDGAVDGIRRIDDPEQRLALLRAVFEGMLAVEGDVRKEMLGTKGPGAPEHWCTGRVSPWCDRDSGPMVGASLGAPPARFNRRGRPQLDYAAMRFIVSSRENFAWLMDLAAEGLAAREAAASAG